MTGPSMKAQAIYMVLGMAAKMALTMAGIFILCEESGLAASALSQALALCWRQLCARC